MYRNYIEELHREKEQNLTDEYLGFYPDFKYNGLDLLLSTLHSELLESFKTLNQRLPTGDYEAHFWADSSRTLMNIIEQINTLQRRAQQSEYAFEIKDDYKSIIKKCDKFLSSSGGSQIPPNMEKIVLYYVQPIFIKNNSIKISNDPKERNANLQFVGEGSYALVYKFEDVFYGKKFILKRAKKDLNEKELLRFKQEFEIMKYLNSPYIVEVFKYNEEKKEYIMEFLDCTLHEYINKNNNTLTKTKRKSIVAQILKAFEYIASKNILHRDISPKNVLIKKYEDTDVIKISDFGLVKIPDSDLTSVNTELKGYFNDPDLRLSGFGNYTITHETYALTRLIFFVMTGKTNTENISDPNLKKFISKGLNPNHSLRYKSIKEIEAAVKAL